MTYPRQSWRLLITPPSPGAWNMAVDDALLEAVEHEESLPCLRLYAWQPPCLSIGYAQPWKDIDLPRLLARHWDWVRRPTGGRAILHTDELTYSVIAPITDPRMQGGVLESYQRLSLALLAALRSLDLPAESHLLAAHGDDRDTAAVCFEVPSNYEIVIQGKKIIGSAQARRKHAVLQHGSFPLWGDLTRITDVLSFPDDQARKDAATRLLSHAATAELILGRRPAWDAVVHAFASSFQSELHLELIDSGLSRSELDRAQALVNEKYCHPAWLERL